MIYVLSPLTIMVVGGIWVGLSRRIGRVQALMCSKVAGCAAMVALVLLFHRGASKFLVLVPVYLLRTSLMNGTYPIQESILMDCVPSEMRARWKRCARGARPPGRALSHPETLTDARASSPQPRLDHRVRVVRLGLPGRVDRRPVRLHVHLPPHRGAPVLRRRRAAAAAAVHGAALRAQARRRRCSRRRRRGRRAAEEVAVVISGEGPRETARAPADEDDDDDDDTGCVYILYVCVSCKY